YLLAYLQTAPVVMKIDARERTLIYLFATETGLRFAAVRRVRVSHLVEEQGKGSVFVRKRNRIKYSTDRFVPIRDLLWTALQRHVVDKDPAQAVFRMPPRGHGAKMVKADLNVARRKWIAEAPDEQERRRREESDF